jgi:hypothetical protein
MADELALLCGGALILLALAVIAFVLRNPRAFIYQKRKEGENTIITITARRNLERVSVLARFGGEEVYFERKRIRKGQTVDFSFPSSDNKAKITVDLDSGKHQVSEV